MTKSAQRMTDQAAATEKAWAEYTKAMLAVFDTTKTPASREASGVSKHKQGEELANASQHAERGGTA